jgi:hypothetical protein
MSKWKEDATHGLMLLRRRNYSGEKNKVTRGGKGNNE